MNNKEDVKDIIFSTILLPITILALGIAFYLFYKQLTAIPFILLASLIYGFSCLSISGIKKLRQLGKFI